MLLLQVGHIDGGPYIGAQIGVLHIAHHALLLILKSLDRFSVAQPA